MQQQIVARLATGAGVFNSRARIVRTSTAIYHTRLPCISPGGRAVIQAIGRLAPRPCLGLARWLSLENQGDSPGPPCLLGEYTFSAEVRMP